MGKDGSPKIGPKLVVDGEKEYKATIAEINKSMAVLASEAKKTAAAYAEDKDSLEALKAQTEDYNQKAEEQRKKVEVLSDALKHATEEFGENDKRTKDWQIQLNKAEAELIMLESAIKKNNEKIKENSTLTAKVKSVYGDWKDNINDLKEAHPHLTKSVENANKAAKALGSAGFNAIKTGAAAAIGGVTGFTAAGLAMAAKLNEISEETKELRENLGKLETCFTTNGHSAETAENTYKDLYTVLGDSDKATEAASHLALLCENQKQLDEWITITTGVYAQFGDSLPIEALTEAANETAKTGSVTGALADALNWVGESEEGFQKKLEACNTEQERSELITKTLNGLYSEQAEKYREVNETLLAANEAQVECDLKMAGLGDTVDGIKNKLKAEFLPGVSDVVDGLSAMLAGDEGAPELIKKGVTDCVNNFGDMVPEVLELLSSMGETLEDVAPEIVSVLANGITKSAPDMAESANKLISGLLTGLITEDNIDGFSKTAVTLVSSLVSLVGDNADLMMDGAGDLVISLVDSLCDPNNSSKLVTGALDVVMAIVTALISNAPEMIAGGVELIGVLVNEIKNYDWWGVAKNIFEGIKTGFKNIFSSEPDGSHAGGIDYVPYDGYVAAMHRGEQLLTASEAVVYRNERAGNAEDYAELSRKIDALAARQETPVNWSLNASGSMSALVRAMNLSIERENRRKTAKA